MAGRSFGKREKIRSPGDFLRAKKEGRRCSTRSFSVYLLEGAAPVRRLGLAVSARVGGAVKRNRIKRLLREFFRQNKALFPKDSDVVVSARPGAADTIKALKDVEKEFIPLLEKLKGGAQKTKSDRGL